MVSNQRASAAVHAECIGDRASTSWMDGKMGGSVTRARAARWHAGRRRAQVAVVPHHGGAGARGCSAGASRGGAHGSRRR
eukprot:7381966-Prymnesium_polylepis.2